MANTFSSSLKKTLKNEGTDLDTLLPGIVSKYGIRQEILDAYNKRSNLPLENIKDVDPKKVEKIYHDIFYIEPGYDKLPPKIATQAFDFGVQSGPSRSTMVIQSLVGAKPDGIIGPKTLLAIQSYVEKNGEDTLIKGIIDTRRTYIESLIKNHPKKFGGIQKGLRNRVNAMEEK